MRNLGTPNEQWWPNRMGLSEAIREFEAESACYLVCGRAGIDNPSDKYLAGYIGQNSRVPEITLECVMAAARLIEKMGRERLKPRKDGVQSAPSRAEVEQRKLEYDQALSSHSPILGGRHRTQPHSRRGRCM